MGGDETITVGGSRVENIAGSEDRTISGSVAETVGGAQTETITGALGDTTRRGIYVMIREAHQTVTASQIAANFQIHPNVARHHLDRLTNDGFIRVSARQREHTSAGRPAKR